MRLLLVLVKVETLAGYLASNGKKVALIEQDSKMYGGTCINIGCLPSKSLVKNALLSPKDANFVEKQTFYAKAVQEEQNLTTTLRQKTMISLIIFPMLQSLMPKESFIVIRL
ncbi:hypothetical protein [Helicobacter apodemus]|uniref:hypothetical protein n=1 Tax=Helicobacter apodemus TaxID=135569 RepID=UPI000A52C665|nr:hypothetical protein [Helicobacter apodemus]